MKTVYTQFFGPPGNDEKLFLLFSCYIYAGVKLAHHIN